MYNTVITLVGVTLTPNQYGDEEATYTERTVFAELGSITRSEFYQAAAGGFKPEVRFTLPDYLDYQGEQLIKFKPYGGVEETYSVIRTYIAGQTLELVCKRGVD